MTASISNIPWRQRLRTALENVPMAFDEISTAAGFNKEYVSKMLNGQINPTVSKVLMICEVADIKPELIFSTGFDNERSRQLLETTSRLTESEAQLALRLLRSIK